MLATKEALSRWVDQVYPKPAALTKALKERKLKIYHGIDPTGPELHLGHSTNLLLLRHFQDLGHRIIILIGDATATIGDPTGRDSARQPLTRKEVLANARTYKDQAGKILRFSGRNKVEIEYNSRWWGKMKFLEGLRLGYLFTSNQMLERDMFQERIKKENPPSLAEFYYPMMQGYDSVEMGVDAEVGGTDQTFNMLIGRDMLRKMKNKEKFVITTKLLENPKTGKKLMSKSGGGYIPLTASAQEMFGAVMGLPDEAVVPVFTLCTTAEIKNLKRKAAADPLATKKELARVVTAIYHGEASAQTAVREFAAAFGRGEAPAGAPVWKKAGEKIDLPRTLVKEGLAESRSAARRLIAQGGVRLNGRKITETEAVLDPGVLRVGKKIFIKIE